jgi:hypothetical protein
MPRPSHLDWLPQAAEPQTRSKRTSNIRGAPSTGAISADRTAASPRIGQCMATVSGIGGSCEPNQFYYAQQAPVRKRKRVKQR